MAAEQLAPVFGGHVDSLNQILDPHRHAVDRRQGRTVSIPLFRLVRRGAGGFRVHDFPRFHVALDGIDLFKTAFEIGARRIRSVVETRDGIVKGHQFMGSRIVARTAHDAAPPSDGFYGCCEVYRTR